MTGANVMRVVIGVFGVGMLIFGVFLALSFFGGGGTVTKISQSATGLTT